RRRERLRDPLQAPAQRQAADHERDHAGGYHRVPCFYEHAVFSVTAIGEMNLHRVPLDDFADLCLARARIATALLWFAAREAAIYAEHIADAGRRAPIERLAHFILEMLTRLRAIGAASA